MRSEAKRRRDKDSPRMCLPDMRLVYVAGASFTAEQPMAAKALIDFMADPKAAAVYKAKGLQPD
jgi:hypothetical protein